MLHDVNRAMNIKTKRALFFIIKNNEFHYIDALCVKGLRVKPKKILILSGFF
jgi:hypothetical protein